MHNELNMNCISNRISYLTRSFVTTVQVSSGSRRRLPDVTVVVVVMVAAAAAIAVSVVVVVVVVVAAVVVVVWLWCWWHWQRCCWWQ
jgi:Flp pilus assembly protein TadB